MASIGPPANDNTIKNVTSTLHLKGHQSFASVDDGRRNADTHAEFLKVLKRRSLPHLPKRSSSLTLPPITPPAESLPSSPVKESLSDDDWRSWLGEFLDGRRSTPPPLMKEDMSPNDWEGFKSPESGIDANASGINRCINNSEASKVDPLSVPFITEKPPSRRYRTLLADLWRWRPRLSWPAKTHPLVCAYRYTQGDFLPGEVPLDVGCMVLEQHSEPLQGTGVRIEEFNIYNEDENPLANLNRSVDLAFADTVGLDAADRESEHSTIGLPPSSPRPAFQHIYSAASGVLDGFQRLSEAIAILKAQKILEAALLLNLRMGRTLSNLAALAAAATPFGRGEPDGQESASSVYFTNDTALALGDGRLIIDDAADGPTQETEAGEAQYSNLERFQGPNSPLDQVLNPSRGISNDCSPLEVGSNLPFVIESEDAEDWGDMKDLAPLTRVKSHRPPCR